jgi:hypothetical protein
MQHPKMPFTFAADAALGKPLDIDRVVWDLEFRAALKRELNAIADRQGRRWTDPLTPLEAGDNVERFPIEKTARRKAG